ncbi:hypothetical protein ERHA55_52970 (plasmid) [Erwinia rhapontici]|nr:ATP-binding cassette domain-containing protein [Erwinia rhapontici]BCQ47770.1 hypothetical protein ERHA55_52970 [Erwinia rhapontici]
MISIIGPSGSGKSTLLRSLNLLVKPDSGQLTIGDMSVDSRRLSRSDTRLFRRQSAMVFQHYNLFRNKTALENITEVLIYGLGYSRADAAERGMALLTSVGWRTRPLLIRNAVRRSAAAGGHCPCAESGTRSLTAG